MTDKSEKTLQKDGKPVSKKRLLIYFLAAYAGAALLIVLAVLPARYGIDPLGIGKMTGISKQAETRQQNVEAIQAAATESAFVHLQDIPFKTETIRIDIEDLGEVEYKMVMPEGAGLVYSWQVEGETPAGGVYYEFHGHPGKADRSKYPEGFYESYTTGEKPSDSGSFTAPFKGYHGWYFLNIEEGPITVVLHVSGFYDDHLEIYRAVQGEVTNSVDY